ncbi:serine hydrolase, partial [Bosea thiooxidans]
MDDVDPHAGRNAASVPRSAASRPRHGGLAAAGHAQSFQSPAPFAILLDSESGAVLYEKAADELMVPASMAKLATVLVAFQDMAAGRLTPDSEIGISEDAGRKGGAPSGGSTMFAMVDGRLKLSDILRASSSSPATMPRSRWRRRLPATKRDFRTGDDRAGEGARPDEIGLRQRDGNARPAAARDRPRAGAAGG